MTKGRVVEREQTVAKGQRGCCGAGDAFSTDNPPIHRQQLFLYELRKVTASWDNKGESGNSREGRC
jgi:hypothetical protein